MADDEGGVSTVEIKLSVTNNPPEITTLKSEVDVTGGKKVTVN